jgi:hypothetical protein
MKPVKKKSGRQSTKSTKSNTKIEWEKLLNNKESKRLLVSSWNTPNPQKTFSSNVKKIINKHSHGSKPKPKPKKK